MVLPIIVARSTSPVLTLHALPSTWSNGVKLPNGPFHRTMSQYALASALALNSTS
jgi:hypothetical protein